MGESLGGLVAPRADNRPAPRGETPGLQGQAPQCTHLPVLPLEASQRLGLGERVSAPQGLSLKENLNFVHQEIFPGVLLERRVLGSLWGTVPDPGSRDPGTPVTHPGDSWALGPRT